MAAVLSHWSGHYTRQRRLIQAAFLAVFALLPVLDLLRFDFVKSRLYLFGSEIWLDEWALLWLALMFAMWLVGGVSLVFGRVYCAYACPQTVFSELAHDIGDLGRRLARRLAPPWRERAARAVSYVLLAALSVAGTALLMGYFAPLPDVLQRLARLDIGPWVGAIGAITTALTFANLAWVRETFCQTACPYGLLQGVIEDGRSLHVRLAPEKGQCIDCAACARVCPMEIDIRDGSFQIECTRCGSCVDACDAVLHRLKPARPSVLVFDLGGVLSGWDVKRTLVTVSTVGFGVALALAVATRQPLAFQLSPVYSAEAEGASTAAAESHYLLRASNRGRSAVRLDVRAEGLPGASIEGLADPVLPPGEERRFDLVVRVPRAEVQGGVTPFVWVIGAAERQQRIPATFFARKAKLS